MAMYYAYRYMDTLTPDDVLRVRLSKAEKVKLIRLCVVHQSEHRHGNKKVFWSKIRGLLFEDIGKELRDPQQTVDGLVAQFQADIAREETGTGR